MNKIKSFGKIFFVIMVASFLLMGCQGQEKDVQNLGKAFNHPLKTEKVSVSVVKNSVSNTTIELIMQNNTNESFSFLPTYEIQKKYGNTWYNLKIIEEIQTMFLGTPIKPRESTPFKINWERYYGKLSSGDYRIVINIYDGDDEFYTGTEFTIK